MVACLISFWIGCSRPVPPRQDMLAEAMRVGLPEAKNLFAEPEGDGDGSGTPSKAERGKAEGAVLGRVRAALESRHVLYGVWVCPLSPAASPRCPRYKYRLGWDLRSMLCFPPNRLFIPLLLPRAYPPCPR